MLTADELNEQRAIVGTARSDCGVLLTAIDGLKETFAAYDRLRLSDDSILDDQALLPLGTTRADLRGAISSFDILVMLLDQGHQRALELFARGR